MPVLAFFAVLQGVADVDAERERQMEEAKRSN